MPAKATSQLLRASKLGKAKDSAKKEAVRLYRLEQAKPRAERRSAAAIGRQFGIHGTTITRLAKPGARTIADFNEGKNILGQASREVLVRWILEMADRALPVTRRLLKQKVLTILRETNPDSSIREINDSWVDRFLASPICRDISSRWSSPLAKDRAQAVNPTTLKYWFGAVEKHVVAKHIPAGNQYGMDETNLMEGMFRKVRVLGPRGCHIVYKRQGGSRRTVTVTEVICADGTVLPPTIIFRGVKLLRRWGKVNPLNASIARARKGYTNKALSVSWLRMFDNLTKHKNDKPRVLFLDPHNSHYSLAFLEYAISQNIVVLGYYPKTTHVCQGLDVVCFAALKRNYAIEKERFEQHGGKVDGGTFLQVFAPVHRRTFKPEVVRSAFRRTGLVPFDPSRIVNPKTLAPSKELSSEGAFPIPQPSPVRAVVDAFKTVRLRLSQSAATSMPNRRTISAPPTPHANRHLPTLTMTQRAARMADKLSATSASFLVSDDNPFTSASRLPPPILPRLPLLPEVTWDTVLASPAHKRSRDELEYENHILRETLQVLRGKLVTGESMLEGQNCQLILQNLYAEDLREQLYHQESKRRKKGHADALLHTDMGQVFTAEEFLEAVRKDEESANNKVKTADLRAGRAKWKAQEKEQIDTKYASMHAEWVKKRDRMKKEGKRGGWGRAPARPKRGPTPEEFRVLEKPQGEDGNTDVEDEGTQVEDV